MAEHGLTEFPHLRTIEQALLYIDAQVDQLETDSAAFVVAAPLQAVLNELTAAVVRVCTSAIDPLKGNFGARAVLAQAIHNALGIAIVLGVQQAQRSTERAAF